MTEAKVIQRDRRLRQLREDYEKAFDDNCGKSNDVADYPPEEIAATQYGSDELPSIKTMIEAARRYIIARDFNEFRDGKWQTIWKLQNNN